MLQVSDLDIENRIRFDNPWWVAGQGIDEEWAKFPHRDYFASFLGVSKEISIRRAVILMGPRRVGKTIMMQQVIHELLREGIPGNTILYLSLETPIYTGLSLEHLLQIFMQLNHWSPQQSVWIFFDEIQYLKDWELHLKSLVDSYKHCRFVVSGSSAAALKMKSSESGAGRFTEFLLPPLTFAEYLRFIEREDELILPVGDTQSNRPLSYRVKNLPELNREFLNYLNFGGYPEAVFNKGIQLNSRRYLKQDIVEKVLLKDLPSLYGIHDTQELNQLFNTLAYNVGQEISLDSLAKNSSVSKTTLVRYLEYLEAAFLVRRVLRVDKNKSRFQRVTNFKIYLSNPSLRAALFGPVTETSPALGHVVENAVYSQWLHNAEQIRSIHYGRWKKGRKDLEVDIISLAEGTTEPQFVVEVKWSDRAFDHAHESEGLQDYCKANPPKRMPLITTLSKSGKKELNGIMVEFTPCSLHCYTVSKNTLRKIT